MLAVLRSPDDDAAPQSGRAGWPTRPPWWRGCGRRRPVTLEVEEQHRRAEAGWHDEATVSSTDERDRHRRRSEGSL